MSESTVCKSSITVARNDLAAAVTFASMALSKRPALPVLGGMLAAISCGTLTVSAFNYDTTTSVKVPGQATAPARILVDGKDLAAAVKSLPKGKNVQATITITDSMVITCDGTKTVLSPLPLEDYPTLPAMPDAGGYIDGASFARTIGRIAPIAGTDDTLPMLTHVYFTSDRGQLELAATDRYRLAVDRLHWTGPDATEMLIPAAVLARFAKSADKSGKIALHSGTGVAGLSDGVRTVITRTYPLNERGRTYVDYPHLMRPADDNDTVALAGAGALLAAVDRAAKLTGRNERMGFDVTDGRITVTAVRDGQPVGTQHIMATVDGPDAPFGFNAGYLASVLAGFAGTVRMGFKTRVTRDSFGKERVSQQPLQLSADGDTFTALVMPVRRADS